MNEYLSKNLEAVKSRHNEIVINQEIIETLERKKDITEIDSHNGYMLKSQIDQNIAINAWCEQFEELKHNEVVIVFGVGSLEYYVRFSDMYPKTDIVIYEPCEEIFYNSIACHDYSELLKRDHIYFCMGKRIHDSFTKSINKVMGYESITNPYFAIIPNYNKMFEEEYHKYEEVVRDLVESNIASRQTMINFENQRLDNYLDNLTTLPYESTSTELINTIKTCDTKNYPAIILSAGPSLDKNIKKIKDIKGRAFVIAVDAAVNTATKNNIRPDIIISVDSFMYEDSLRDDMGRELPLVIHMYGSIPIRNLNKGRHFYISDKDYYLGKTLEVCDKKMRLLETGGSVSNEAFSLAQQMGFETIILMGQDLGFPGNKQHAEDAFDDEEEVTEDDDRYFAVKSIDGDYVLTSFQMNTYRKWFERMIKLYPDLNVIDATEGGALIEGATIMTIDEAIDKYCPFETIDFEGMINASDYLLEGEERDKVKGIINKTFEDIDDNIEYFEKAKRSYYKLRDLNEKKKYNTTEFKRVIERIGEYNKFIEDNKDFVLYKKCCTEKYFECIDSLKTVYDNEYDEIKNLVNQSLIMLDEYIRSAKVLKEKWNELNK